MTARRSFLARFAAAVAAFGLGESSTHAQESRPAPAAALPGTHWQPAREAKDDWFDQIPGKHRLFFDAVSPDGAAAAIRFANNFFTANKTGYGLEQADVAVVICLRHRATQFAFTDAIWAKHGAAAPEPDNRAPARNGGPLGAGCLGNGVYRGNGFHTEQRSNGAIFFQGSMLCCCASLC